MVYGYARISTSNQANGNGLECQERELRAAGADEIISEQYSGYKMNRPKFSALVKLLKSGDTLIVTKLDRFARTAAEGATLIRELVSKGIKVNILNMGIADDTPIGRMMITILLAFSEYERDLITERCQSGKAIAKENNPDFTEGRPRIKKYKIDNALNLLDKHSVSEVVKITGISRATIMRYKRVQNADTAAI